MANLSTTVGDKKGGKRAKVKKFFKDNYTGWLFNLPLAIGILVFTLIPVVFSLIMSFYQSPQFVFSPSDWMDEFVGFKNYEKVLNSSLAGFIAKNTFLYTLISVPLGLVVSYFLALLVSKEQRRGVKVYRILYYMPCMIPAAAGAVIWKKLTAMNVQRTDGTFFQGLFNEIVVFFGGKPFKWHDEEDFRAILSIIMYGLWGAGGGMLLWLSAFKSIDKQYYEAADVEGASKLRKLVSITLPMSTPMIFYNLIMSVIGTIQSTVPLTYGHDGGGGKNDALNMLGLRIYYLSFGGDARSYGKASALAWITLLIVGVLTAILFKTSKWVYYGDDDV